MPKVHCRVFEDNSRALEMASNPKYHPCMKHIATKHHYFHIHMERGDITVVPISTLDQRADLLMKGTVMELFESHCLANQGW